MNQKFSLFLCAFLLLLLCGCRNEENFLDQPQAVKSGFSVFTKKDENTPIDYRAGFEILAEKYQKYHPLEKNQMLRTLQKGESIDDTESYINFQFHSQLFTEKNGDKWMLFPKMQGGKVVELIAAGLINNGTEVYFISPMYEESVYNSILAKFQSTIDQHHTPEKREKYQLYTRYNNIEVVVIVVPNPLPISSGFCEEHKCDGGGGNEGPWYSWRRGVGGECDEYNDCGITIGGGSGDGNYPDTYKKYEEENTPCEKAKKGKQYTEKMLKDPKVKEQVDKFMKGKINAKNEWSASISLKPDGTYAVSSPQENGPTSGSIPPPPNEGIYVGDAHTHSGSSGAPSGQDMYGMLSTMEAFPTFSTRLIYGTFWNEDEIYALVVTDRALALKFLEEHPKDQYYDMVQHEFKEGTPLGDDYFRILEIGSLYRYKPIKGNNYPPTAIAMAYVLEKHNIGLSLLKADKNGNFKAFRISDINNYEIPYSDGKKVDGAKIDECP